MSSNQSGLYDPYVSRGEQAPTNTGNSRTDQLQTVGERGTRGGIGEGDKVGRQGYWEAGSGKHMNGQLVWRAALERWTLCAQNRTILGER